MSTTDTYERITAKLLSLIDGEDLLPWQKPWKGSSQWARSMSSRKEYRGVNRWVLTLTAQVSGWSPWFGTYDEIQRQGGQVRKGEKSTLAVWWSVMEKVDKVTGEKKKFAMLRTFNLFSASQADGLPERYYDKPAEAEFSTDESAEEVLNGYFTREGITVSYGGDSAHYAPRTDSIQLPHFASFIGAEEAYSTYFHEATHSTGAEKRLNRPGITEFDHFGSHLYSREELVAEIGSALVLGTLGLDTPAVTANQASYLKNWKKALGEDPQALVWAAGRAEKAANLILNIQPAEAEKEEATV